MKCCRLSLQSWRGIRIWSGADGFWVGWGSGSGNWVNWEDASSAWTEAWQQVHNKDQDAQSMKWKAKESLKSNRSFTIQTRLVDWQNYGSRPTDDVRGSLMAESHQAHSFNWRRTLKAHQDWDVQELMEQSALVVLTTTRLWEWLYQTRKGANAAERGEDNVGNDFGLSFPALRPLWSRIKSSLRKSGYTGKIYLLRDDGIKAAWPVQGKSTATMFWYSAGLRWQVRQMDHRQ